MPEITIRPAKIDDAATILQFIIELAIYEKAEHEVLATVESIEHSIFGPDSVPDALICEVDGQAAGFACYFFSYSTWQAKPSMYLEDLYISEAHRGCGGGVALLKALAKISIGKNCCRLEWSVLDWNTPAIDFYDAIGAKPQNEWIKYRMDGEVLSLFAKQA